MTVTIGRISDNVKGAIHVRVDRTSIVGNPFPKQSEAHRDEACDKYETYFYEQLDSSPVFSSFIARLKRLHDKGTHLHLMCHCVPKRCHSETIKRYLES